MWFFDLLIDYVRSETSEKLQPQLFYVIPGKCIRSLKFCVYLWCLWSIKWRFLTGDSFHNSRGSRHMNGRVFPFETTIRFYFGCKFIACFSWLREHRHRKKLYLTSKSEDLCTLDWSQLSIVSIFLSAKTSKRKPRSWHVVLIDNERELSTSMRRSNFIFDQKNVVMSLSVNRKTCLLLKKILMFSKAGQRRRLFYCLPW